MRKKPLKICARPGCTEKTTERYCEKHKKHYWSEHDKKRANSNQRGYDYQWSKFRKWFLNKNPLCKMCLDEGFAKEANEVDHIKPLVEYPELKYEPSNCRSLCKRCHSKRTWLEQGVGKNGKKEESDSFKASRWHF